MIESSLFAQGFHVIAGVDEAGRGACAGPLVAAAVAIDHQSPLLELGVLDSKRFTPPRREELFQLISSTALSIQVVSIPAHEIDENGLQEMNLAAMRRAVAGLSVEPDYLMSDGYPVAGLATPTLSMYKGDSISIAIGAASIVAKVTRDRIMVEMDQRYPGYGFSSHKGYSSATHMKAISKLGISEIHRTSYRNVAAFLSR